MLSAVELFEPTFADAQEAINYGTLIGAGSFRSVYRYANSPWVYKKNHCPETMSGNAQEFETYKALIGMGFGSDRVKLPKMVMLQDDILAAEFIDGVEPGGYCFPAYTGKRYPKPTWHDDDCNGSPNCWASIVGSTDIRDVYNNNVVQIADGTVYIVDLGNGSDSLKG